ncbi:MAG: dolichyl-phosphate-mannose-mannosyltransferase family protein [Verrucomicrobiaceae bacterium]|nr:dolichyl-phosphate-mannose-mannosyltransferase family protein [Verrucomicrobiaceae bacterium]
MSSSNLFARNDRSLRADVAFLLCLLVPAFLLLLGLRPLSVPDEGRYPEIAREMMLSGDYITPKINGIVFLDKPALYYWLQTVSFHIFGVHSWSVRLMPALFGVLGVVVVFVTSAKLFSRRAGWWSAIILATSPLYFLSSQYADMNIEIAVLVTTALCFFLLGNSAGIGSKERRNLFLAAWLAMGLGIMTKGLIGIVFPAMIIGAWVCVGWRWRQLRHFHFLKGILIIGIICLPWFLAVQNRNPQFFHFFFIYQQFDRFTGSGFNNVFPVWFYVPVIAVGFLPWSVWLPSALREQWQRARNKISDENADAYQLLLLWPLLILIFFSIPTSKVVGYILPTLPPLAMLMGDFLARRFEENKHGTEIKSIWVLRSIRYFPWVGGFVILAAIITVSIVDHSGIRPLANMLQKEITSNDVIVSYRTYYQDLPMYLLSQKPMVIVDDWKNPAILQEDNWRREFYLGLQNQPEANNWLIEEAEFAHLLSTQNRVFVMARMRDEKHLAEQYGLKVIRRDKKNVLMATASIH